MDILKKNIISNNKIKKQNKKYNKIIENFNWINYIENYKDLRDAGIDTEEKAYKHWINHGEKEGRTYLDKDCINYGEKEEKSYINKDFDWIKYVENYKDLQEAGINTKEKAYRHWINHGKKEGRTYKNINDINNNINNNLNIQKKIQQNLKLKLKLKNKKINENLNNLLNNIKLNTIGKKNIVIYPHLPFNLSDGGITVQYYLAQILKEMGENVVIYNNYGMNKNNIFDDYIDRITEDELNNTIVIYCEGIRGNPLKAKYVVRWMLSELGKNVPFEWKNTWGENELVYYFNPESKFYIDTNKIGDIYKSMYLIYINSEIKNLNLNRNGWCFTYRKKHYHKSIKLIHPNNSFKINRKHIQRDYINIFNKHKYFVSYDPLTFLSIIALLCGCISIVYPLEGIDKKTWIRNSCIGDFINNTSGELYGLAYGIDDLEYAENTIHLAETQFDGLKKYCIEKMIKPFLNDINNFENNNNTLKNNF